MHFIFHLKFQTFHSYGIMRFYANIWLLRLTLSLIIASTVIAADPDVWSFFGKNLRYQVGGGGCAPDKSIPGSPASKRDPEKVSVLEVNTLSSRRYH